MIQVEIVGERELRREMRQAASGLPRELTKALKQGSFVLLQRMIELAPRGDSEDLVGSFTPFSTAKVSGVRSTLPYAGVQEFAKRYPRVSRSGRRHMVQMHGEAPPRFGYKALDQVIDKIAEQAHEAIVDLLDAHGWLA